MKLYHGCRQADAQGIMDAIAVTHRGFFMTPDVNIAMGYGSTVICFTVGDFKCLIRTIDKTGDAQSDIASGLEYVINTHNSLVSFYRNLENMYLHEYIK